MFIAGLLVGTIDTYFRKRSKTAGTLRLYYSDEPGGQPYLFVELDKPVREVCRHKIVSFKISLK